MAARTSPTSLTDAASVPADPTFDYARFGDSTAADYTNTDPDQAMVYVSDGKGGFTMVQDRRRTDRRQLMRRWDDRDAALAATERDTLERAEAAERSTRRAWTMLAIGYSLGLFTTLALLFATS